LFGFQRCERVIPDADFIKDAISKPFFGVPLEFIAVPKPACWILSSGRLPTASSFQIAV
jgi:hypothetical protein